MGRLFTFSHKYHMFSQKVFCTGSPFASHFICVFCAVCLCSNSSFAKATKTTVTLTYGACIQNAN